MPSHARRTVNRPIARRALLAQTRPTSLGTAVQNGASRATECGRPFQNPQPARHVGQFCIRLHFRCHGERLEPHAADRTTSRHVATDLRVHRAGVGRAPCGPAGLIRLRAIEIRVGVGDELRTTAGGTKRDDSTISLGALFCGCGLTDIPQTGSFVSCGIQLAPAMPRADLTRCVSVALHRSPNVVYV